MASDRTGAEGPNQRFADYKVLFYGACSVCALLGGYAFELSRANSTDESERNSATNRVQWERLKDLNDSLIEVRGDLKTLRRDVDDLETRARAIEKASRR